MRAIISARSRGVRLQLSVLLGEHHADEMDEGDRILEPMPAQSATPYCWSAGL
jgi:hypothetical protein